MNEEDKDTPAVSEEDKRIVAELIARMPVSVSTNLTTGEVVKVYKDGRVVKSTIDPKQSTINILSDDNESTGKIEIKTNLDF